MDSKQELSQLSFFQLSLSRMFLVVSSPPHITLTTWEEWRLLVSFLKKMIWGHLWDASQWATEYVPNNSSRSQQALYFQCSQSIMGNHDKMLGSAASVWCLTKNNKTKGKYLKHENAYSASHKNIRLPKLISAYKCEVRM